MKQQVMSGAIAVAAVVLVGCGGEEGSPAPAPTVVHAEPRQCDRDTSTEEAQTAVERTGGLRTEHFRVRFVQSTDAGVVALVSGDVERAARELVEEYDVHVVAPWQDGVKGIHDGAFVQVERVVAAACP